MGSVVTITCIAVASIEIDRDHQLQYLIGSRKHYLETGRFLSPVQAIDKLRQGHTITCAVGVAGTVKKTYVQCADGSIHITEGACPKGLFH